MISCNVFEMEAQLVEEPERALRYSYWTDLPAGTLLIVDCTRSFTDYGGKKRHWVLFNDRLTVGPNTRGDFNGGAGEIRIAEGDQRALRQFEELLPHLSSGMQTPPTERIRLELCVGGRQRLKAFGKSNEALVGGMVSKMGDMRIVRVERTVQCPLEDRFNPLTEAE